MFIELVAVFASLLVPTVQLFLVEKQPEGSDESENEPPTETRIEREIREHEFTKCLLNESRESEQELMSRINELEDRIALSGGGRRSAAIKVCEERAKNYMLGVQNAELEKGIEEAFELVGAQRNPVVPLVADLHGMVQDLVR